MTRSETRARLVLTTNIPTPYRLAFFDVLARVAAARDIDFEVMFYAATEPNRRWSVDMESQRYPWAILPGLHPRMGGIYPHLNPSLPLLLRRRRATWILIAGAWNTPSSLMAASRLLSGPGYRVLWSEGHSQAVLHPTGPIAALRRACWRRIDGFAVPNDASRQFVHSQLERPAPCLRLPNTVDEDFYLAGTGFLRAELRCRLGIADDDVVVLCVAELSDRKGVAELANAVALISPDRRRRTILIFAGEGPLRERIESVGNGVRVRLLGHVDQEAVRDWMYAADVFVLPSKMDPNPLSAIEAAFCGAPLILSPRAGNAAELVIPGRSGWVFPGLEPGEMAPVLEAAVAMTDDERRTIGLRAREVALAHFSRERVAERFLDDLLREFPRR